MIIPAEKMKALLIDPNSETLDMLSLGLKLRWPDCSIVHTGEGTQGIGMAETESPHMIVMEINLTDIDGFEVIRHIRLFSNTPIIILSARTDEMDIVRALEMGADDYVIKPFSPLDFLARSKAILRRIGMYPSDGEDLPPFITDSFSIDFSARRVIQDDQEVHLTPTEYRLLCQLVRNAGRLVTIQSLKEQVWGNADYLESGTVRKCVCQLRNKLGDDSSNPHIILNERGIGYKFISRNHSNSAKDTLMDANSQEPNTLQIQ